MSVRELCADDGTASKHLQTSEQDAENTAAKKKWHCIVQSMTDQHGVTLECMIQEKISAFPRGNRRN